MKYNVDEIQKNMHIRQVEGIGDRLEEDIRNILNRAGIYFRIFSRAKTTFSIAQKLEKPGYGFGEHDKKMHILLYLVYDIFQSPIPSFSKQSFSILPLFT